MIRTKKQLENVERALTVLRERLPEFSAFGDQNWWQIEIQKEILKYFNEFQFIPSKFKNYNNDEVRDCIEWLDGENNDYYDDMMSELGD